MMDATAAGRTITLPDGRNAAAGDRWRAVCAFIRGLCLALGGVLAACAIVAMVFVASAWLVRSTLGGNPYLRTETRYAVAAAEPADRYASVHAKRFAAPPRMPAVAAESIAALDTLLFDETAAHATASAFRLRTVIAPQLPIASVPRLVAPQVELAALTTGSIPDAGALQDRKAEAPPWHSGNRVAVYDIAGQTVYLPNGERLEAHSGLGHKRDDPRYTRVKNQGPTPPNVYDLTLRERLFHGVQAIRLNPVDERRMYGRDGMLAHTYLLGPSGQSNGCVSFKNYPKFLRAFLRGEIDRLVVVARLGNESWRTVAARARLARRYADGTS